MRILHMFNYPLTVIESCLPKVKEQGFDTIQISPVQPNKFDKEFPWWGLYQPISFTIGNQLGTKDELKHVCKVAQEYDINIIVDVILNHTAGKDDGSIEPHEKVDGNLISNEYFWKSKTKIKDWKNRYDIITNSIGCPGLRLDNYDLQDKFIIPFLNELVEIGVKGFRIDAAKNISLPEENNNHFWSRVIGSFNNKGLIIYSEIIFEKPELLDKYSKYTKIITQSQMNNRNNQINYIENHDTYLEFNVNKNMNKKEMIDKYRHLCNEYPNTLFYIRPFDNTWESEEIKNINR